MTEVRWTSEQAAALTAEGHRLLVANAGTGKTTTVVHKILWLLGEDVGVNAETGERIPRCPAPCTLSEIAAITFTEKAAYDLKRKLREALRKSPRAAELLFELEQAALGTIHSFCGQLLREQSLRMGIDPGFGVLDEQDAALQQDQLIRDVILERLQADDREVAELVRLHNLSGAKFTNGMIDFVRIAFRDLRWHAQRYREWSSNDELSIARLRELFGAAVDDKDEKILARTRALLRLARLMVNRWARYQQAENVRDFDSLILDCRELLTGPQGRAALHAIRERYRILIIDEFQDTDAAQRDIAYAIARDVQRPQLFLVGDPKQSIYRFRGADIAVWNNVQEDLARAAPVLPLSRNFRSEPRIIDFVNSISSAAMNETGAALQQVPGENMVEYAQLSAHRPESIGTVEWIVPENGSEEVRRASEGRHVAQRIADLVKHEPIIDALTGQLRPCRYSDIAILYHTRTGLSAFQDALRAWGIPHFDHSPTGLAERQEVQDLLNLLRLLHNPADDLRVFGYLRSPFVGLRDEVLVRMRKSEGFGYLDQAERFLNVDDWFEAPEHVDLAAIERDALHRGLKLLERARKLADRLPIDELLELVMAESGYRQHLQLLPGSREALANIQAFLHYIEQHRAHTIGHFLQIWDSRDDEAPELPQGQLFSAADDVVTLSTIHAAKGLEWPIVFIVDSSKEIRDDPWGNYWSDPGLGPVLCPKGDDRGPRARRMVDHHKAREAAERARLLYVASTRARDRLIITARDDAKRSIVPWLLHGKVLCEVREETTPVWTGAQSAQIELSWLNVVQAGESATFSHELPAPPHRFMTSATEQMTRAKDPEVWESFYLHGIEPVWQFAPRAQRKDLPERVRGDVIHGVLERMTPDAVLAEVLEETIGEIDAPELEFVLAPGTDRRADLLREIERVLTSAEWKWYVEGENHRELPFLHLAAAREWRIGAFDLYRPDGWIIDFKTHQISKDKVAETGESYRLQMDLYRAAAAVRGVVRTQLHFTHCNAVLEIPFNYLGSRE